MTGQPLQAVVQARVLEPLGIDDMRMAGTYDVRKGDVAHPTTPGRTFMEALGGAGAWLGTAADLVRIVDGLDPSRPGWHPLSSATVKQMLTGQPGIPYSPGQWYGLGVAGVGRRDVGPHRHSPERPVDGDPPARRHHLGGHA